jgi:hypothetical protein
MLFSILRTLLVLFLPIFSTTAYSEQLAETPLYEAVTKISQEKALQKNEEHIHVDIEKKYPETQIVEKNLEHSDLEGVSKFNLSTLEWYADNEPKKAVDFFNDHQTKFTWEDLIIARRLVEIVERREREMSVQSLAPSSQSTAENSNAQVKKRATLQDIDDAIFNEASNFEQKSYKDILSDALYVGLSKGAGIGVFLLFVILIPRFLVFFYKEVKAGRISRKTIREEIRKYTRKARIFYKSRIFRAFFSLLVVWVLALLFTNNLTFEDVFYFDYFDERRFWILLIAPVTFIVMSWVCWHWFRNGQDIKNQND